MVGRTHFQDATPLTLGQVKSGSAAQLEQAVAGIRAAMGGIYELAIGGTAVGTGLNAYPRFGELAARRIAQETGHPFVSASSKFAALSAHDGMVKRHRRPSHARRGAYEGLQALQQVRMRIFALKVQRLASH
jgi:fumarate hydratase class II